MSASTKPPSSSSKPFKPIFLSACALALVLALVRWAGLPDVESLPLFIIGVAVLVVMLFVVAFLAWHLLWRPLPVGHRQPVASALAGHYRQLLGILLGIAGINIVVGGFWDEVWHRQYGIPFGEDLLWRPHLMLYFGFLLTSALAFGALLVLLRRGKGTLQQRFRADPIVGLLVLVGGFLIYALPSDPIWHLIYGEDISAWSLPHLLLSLSFSLIILLAVAILLSTAPPKTWTSLRGLAGSHWLVLLLLSFMLLVLLQVLVTEWDTGSSFVVHHRPVWLLPAILAAAAALIGVLANHTTCSFGAATVVAASALLVRFGLITAFGYDGVSADPWLCTLAPMAALDLAYGLHLRRSGRPPAFWLGGLAALAGMALISFPLINRLFPYPDITLPNLPGMLLASGVGALAGAWLGVGIGDYLGTANKQGHGTEAVAVRLRALPAVALALALAFIVVLITTATPPV